jgi:hypothetical protein
LPCADIALERIKAYLTGATVAVPPWTWRPGNGTFEVTIRPAKPGTKIEHEIRKNSGLTD